MGLNLNEINGWIFLMISPIQMNSMIRCWCVCVDHFHSLKLQFSKDFSPPNLSLYKCLFSLFSLYPQIKLKNQKKV